MVDTHFQFPSTESSPMLFEEQLARKPNLYPWTQDFIDSMWASFWTPNEFNFKGDYAQFRTDLTDAEREMVTRTLSAIGQIEVAVKKFWARLGDNLPHPSLSDLGYVMANSEVIHNQAYEKLLTVLGLGDVFERNLQEPVVRNRVQYLRKYLERAYDDDRQQYIYAIILFTLFIENVSLFSQFYIICWINRNRNLLKDTAQQVQYTRNEETLHAQVGIKIINTLRQEYPELFTADLEARVLEECHVAYAAESALIDWMVGDYAGPGLNRHVLKTYVRQRLNDSLAAIGYPPQFTIDPESAAQTLWMDEALLGNSKTDFFYKKPIDYARSTKAYSPEELFA